MEKIITKDNLSKLIEKLVTEHDVFAPVGDESYSQFRLIKRLDEANLELINTTKPLKELFLPQSEKLFSVSGSGENLAIEPKKPLERKRVIIGAKSCDVKGVELLTKVYEGGTEPDELFSERRKNTLVIGSSCITPGDTCFCKELGINPFEEEGMDLVLIKINGKYFLKSKTKQGGEFLEKFKEYFGGTSPEEIEKKKKLEEKINAGKNNIIDINTIKSFLDKSENDPVWDELSDICVGCGICTYLCPVCQCFDIHDERKNENFCARFRTWDTCQFPDFTQMAGGHNPRGKKKQRIRQRILHKFKYYLENFATAGCTGCGRCIQLCPVNIDILELLKKFK
ncbi:MAG: 4Fe-4S dicluster domain-containing protein [bacterium]